MSKALIFAFALASALAGAPWGARADEPANTLSAMFGELRRCLGRVAIAPGTDVTVQFSINRRGGLIGKPRLTHVQWSGDEEARKASAVAIADGFDRCLPLSITDSFGAAIAGRMIAYRLRRPAAGQEKA